MQIPKNVYFIFGSIDARLKSKEREGGLGATCPTRTEAGLRRYEMESEKVQLREMMTMQVGAREWESETSRWG
jgi:hypothetical protein